MQRRTAGEARIAKVRGALAEHRLDAVVVYGSGRHSFLRANPCWYLSGFKQLGADAAVVVTADDEPHLLVTPAWDAERAASESWIERVTATRTLGGAIETLGLRGRHVGIDGLGAASPATAAAVRAAVGGHDVDGLVEATAGVHDEHALACIRRGVEIAESVVRRACEVARPGLPEAELVAECAAASFEAGADDNFLLMSASQHNHAVHGPSERVLFAGDVVLAEISPSVDGQFSQLCRTFVIGEPSAKQRSAYDVLQEALAAGLAAVAGGVPVAAVAEAVDGVLARHGYEHYNRPPYMRTRGHAMGLGAVVPAEISSSSELLLEAGMSFVLHPNQYFPDAGYLLCGDQVLVEDGGGRSLAQPFDLEAVAG
jgi:Xaa-Pro aminopeptidase